MGTGIDQLSREQLITLLGERERAAREEASQAEQYRSLVQQAADGIFVADVRGFYLEVNESGARMLGMTPGEIVGRHIRDLVLPEDLPGLEADIGLLRQGRRILRERRLRRKDGAILPVEVCATQLSDGRIQGIIRDITSRRQAEEALRLSEERFRSFTLAAFEGIALTERGKLIDANEQLALMLGYGREEMPGLEVWRIVAPESRARVAAAMESGHEGPYEHLALRKDGSVLDVEVRAKTIFLAGRPVRVTAIRDITPRLQAEKAVRESTELAAKAFRASPDAISVSDLQTGRMIEINDGFERLFAVKSDAVIGRTSHELGFWAVPEDRARMLDLLRSQGSLKDFRTLARTATGGLRICLLAAETIQIGERACLVLVVRDITEQMKAEQALRESEERYRAVVEFSPEGVAVAVDDHLVYINPAGANMLGVDGPAAAALIGRSIYDFLPAYRWELARQRRRDVLAHGTPAPPIEGALLRPDGSSLPIEAQAIPLVYGGRPAILNLVRDISARLQSEADRAEAAWREKQARDNYTRELIASQEAERRRIAGELHDSLGQNLLLVKNRVQLALRGTPEIMREQLAAMGELTSQAITEVRQISQNLRPYQLDQIGLVGALSAMIESAAAATGIVFEQKLENVDGLFTADAATNLYRVAQEGLNNLVKHAHARHARVILERDVHAVRLQIEDDGQGFERDGVAGGLGLKNIAERVRILGGAFKADSIPGKGTRLEAVIPVAE